MGIEQVEPLSSMPSQPEETEIECDITNFDESEVFYLLRYASDFSFAHSSNILLFLLDFVLNSFFYWDCILVDRISFLCIFFFSFPERNVLLHPPSLACFWNIWYAFSLSQYWTFPESYLIFSVWAIFIYARCICYSCCNCFKKTITYWWIEQWRK